MVTSLDNLTTQEAEKIVEQKVRRVKEFERLRVAQDGIKQMHGWNISDCERYAEALHLNKEYFTDLYWRLYRS